MRAPFSASPVASERTPNRHDFSLEPPRPNYLSLVRNTGHKVYGVGKIGDIFAHQDVEEEFSTKSNVEGIQKTEELLRTVDDGLIFTNLVETDSLWGHRNDPVNFHRCLQDFDRRLPDLLDALRPNDLLIVASDHGCDPTTPSTDHSREHALLLAYVEGRNAAGRIHSEGEFADVGATVNAWLGGKSAPRGVPAPRSSSRREQMSDDDFRLDNPMLVRWEFASEEQLEKRNALYRRLVEGLDAHEVLVRRDQGAAPTRVLEVGCGAGAMAERVRDELGARDRRDRYLGAHGRADPPARPGGARRRCPGTAVRRRRVRLCLRRLGALPRGGS